MDQEVAPEDLLKLLLEVADDAEKPSTCKALADVNIFKLNENEKSCEEKQLNDKSSVIHSNEVDSSDDEDNKYFENQKYNSCGKDIKLLLKTQESTTPDPTIRNERASSWKSGSKKPGITPKATTKAVDVYTDPYFGIRIINPLVSSSVLQERMEGREAVPLAKLKQFTSTTVEGKNWVVAGVIVSKLAKTSQKGSQFCIWILSDLHNDLKTVSVFLFGSAFKQFWKTSVGVVVGVLNPSILEKKAGSKDEASLSISNAQRIMIFGTSKDLGTCKSTKKNGDKCTAFVNVNRCEYCVYHIRQEYNKCSKRSELQANFAGRGLAALQNKLLGKSELMYGGKLYTAFPAPRNNKLAKRDENRLNMLSGAAPTGSTKKTKKQKTAAVLLESSMNQRKKDLEILRKLGGVKEDSSVSSFTTTFNPSAAVSIEESKKNAIDVISKLKAQSNPEPLQQTPKIQDSTSVPPKAPVLQKFDGNLVDLGAPISRKQKVQAKLNALKYIKQHGPIQKEDPNKVRLKRSHCETPQAAEKAKKLKLDESSFKSDRFKKMIALTSAHTDLLEAHDNEEQEKYFSKLEKKEQMEEKMVSTYKVPCKAVRCLQCKYTSFSASELCKTERHRLRVFDAVKRFFKCSNCGNRTACLELVPMHPCKNCSSSKWKKTGMMKEKVVSVKPELSIRGGEQKFVNSVVTDANINLLLPVD